MDFIDSWFKEEYPGHTDLYAQVEFEVRDEKGGPIYEHIQIGKPSYYVLYCCPGHKENNCTKCAVKIDCSRNKYGDVTYGPDLELAYFSVFSVKTAPMRLEDFPDPVIWNKEALQFLDAGRQFVSMIGKRSQIGTNLTDPTTDYTADCTSLEYLANLCALQSWAKKYAATARLNPAQKRLKNNKEILYTDHLEYQNFFWSERTSDIEEPDFKIGATYEEYPDKMEM